jgi:predicted RNA binding protein YcfA (HicA-like mRNA interferase family)
MGKQDKLRSRLLSKPKNFTWDELESCLKHLGFEVRNGKGSRRKFVHNASMTIINLHEPHPDRVIKSYALEQVINKLIEMELLEDGK